MKPFALTCALGSLFVAAVFDARADTLVNQSSTQNSTLGFTLWTSESVGSETIARTYDSFQVDRDTSIGSVSWQGAYVLETGAGGNPAAPNSTAFEIALFANNNGEPGELIVSADLSLSAVSPKALGTLDFSFSAGQTAPVPLFAYQAKLPAPFPVTKGKTYWLSILSRSTAQEPVWAWMSGTGRDGMSRQMSGGSIVPRQYDRTFTLKSAAGQILTDVDGRAFAAGAQLPLSAAFQTPNAGDEIERVDFLADGAVFASLDANGNPLTGASATRPTRKEAGASAASGKVYQAVFTMPGSDQLVNIVAQALTRLGKTLSAPAVSVQAVSSTTDRPPAVSVSAPARARVGEAVSVPAAVSDPDAASGSANRRGPAPRAFDVPSGLIQRVEYYLNALKVKDSAEAPFGFSFTPAAPGTYVLTAIATDGTGLATASAPVRVEAFAPPTVTASVKGSAIAQEGGATAKFLIARDNADASADLTVLYELSGTAVNGIDYQTLSDSAVIPAGATSVKLKVKAIDDAAANGTRKVKLKLTASPTADYTIGLPKKATISITDND